ncbi:MAG: cupin domain-containing protein [Pseudomonadota bacterium]
MSRILVEAVPDAARLAALGVDKWPVWEKAVSEFPWEYFEDETSYIVAGRAVVTPEGGAPVEIAKGNLVTFQSGLICKWKIVEPIRKHYRFG